jgi:hypothetical protein
MKRLSSIMFGVWFATLVITGCAGDDKESKKPIPALSPAQPDESWYGGDQEFSFGYTIPNGIEATDGPNLAPPISTMPVYLYGSVTGINWDYTNAQNFAGSGVVGGTYTAPLPGLTLGRPYTGGVIVNGQFLVDGYSVGAVGGLPATAINYHCVYGDQNPLVDIFSGLTFMNGGAPYPPFVGRRLLGQNTDVVNYTNGDNGNCFANATGYVQMRVRVGDTYWPAPTGVTNQLVQLQTTYSWDPTTDTQPVYTLTVSSGTEKTFTIYQIPVNMPFWLWANCPANPPPGAGTPVLCNNVWYDLWLPTQNPAIDPPMCSEKMDYVVDINSPGIPQYAF